MRRVARSAADDYANELVPGLRATADARKLADEIAFAAARLERLADDPPGLYAEVAQASEPEEAAWLAFLIAYIAPLEDADPFSAIAAARVPWATGEVPVLDGVPLGPRTAHDPARGSRTLVAYRAWAARAGSQRTALAGDSGWTPQRRFDRAFERLSLPGFGRGPRYEFLLLCGRLGVADLEPSSLQLGREADATVLAAKRVFGIGDAINLHRRAADLASAAAVPIAALDLALLNWARPAEERISAGVRDVFAQAHATRLARILGVATEPPAPLSD